MTEITPINPTPNNQIDVDEEKKNVKVSLFKNLYTYDLQINIKNRE